MFLLVLKPNVMFQTWRDLKRKARKENAAANTARNATGNIIEVPSVSNVALRVLDAIGQDCSVGIGPEETNIGREVVSIQTLLEFPASFI